MEGLLEERELHAKWVLLRGPKTCVVLLGSANFTRKGLGVLVRNERANIEAGVLIRRPASALSLASLEPPILEGGVVDWNRCGASDLVNGPPDEVDPLVAWPDWISRVEIAIDWMAIGEPVGLLRVIAERSAAHPAFTISCPASHSEAETVLVSVPAATSAASRDPTEAAIDGPNLRRLLVSRVVTVRWMAELAVFPVNIDEASRMGLPRVLAVHPDEEQLLAYFHGRIGEDDLTRMLADPALAERRKASQADSANNERLRTLQSYLMREFVESLYGLRQLLVEAMSRTPRAFEQAALGEFSPFALASEVVKAAQSGRRSPTAAAFQLVELLSLIGALEFSSANVEADRSAMEESRAKALSAILKLAGAAATYTPLREAFSERNFLAYARSVLSPPIFSGWKAALAKPAPVVAPEQA
jgi:hypothetical protein